MTDVVDVLKQAIRDLQAQVEQTDDPAEKERLRYEMSCIGGTILELQNPNPRKNGYDSPHWYGPSKKKIPTKRLKKANRR